MPIVYRTAQTADAETITQLAMLLYESEANEYDAELEAHKEYLTNPEMAIFLTFDGDKAIGFSHTSLRYDYVEGTSGGTIGYLEGIYVDPNYRGQGVAKELVTLCENWAKEKGCAEFASDCGLDNTNSLAFHLNIGFEEANRIICFTKKI